MHSTRRSTRRPLPLAVLALACACATEPSAEENFHTSGSREADQRAEQRITKVEQMRGEEAADTAEQRSLYERLGGEEGVQRIVADFVGRVIADPRVNWERKGIERGGVLGIGGKSIEWKPTPDSVARLERHLAQFIVNATSGPVQYEGRDLKEVHHGMKITNAEFDATIGAMKASLDALRLASEEQKELLAILESARPQIAEER